MSLGCDPGTSVSLKAERSRFNAPPRRCQWVRPERPRPRRNRRPYRPAGSSSRPHRAAAAASPSRVDRRPPRGGGRCRREEEINVAGRFRHVSGLSGCRLGPLNPSGSRCSSPRKRSPPAVSPSLSCSRHCGLTLRALLDDFCLCGRADKFDAETGVRSGVLGVKIDLRVGEGELTTSSLP